MNKLVGLFCFLLLPLFLAHGEDFIAPAESGLIIDANPSSPTLRSTDLPKSLWFLNDYGKPQLVRVVLEFNDGSRVDYAGYERFHVDAGNIRRITKLHVMGWRDGEPSPPQEQEIFKKELGERANHVVLYVRPQGIPFTVDLSDYPADTYIMILETYDIDL